MALLRHLAAAGARLALVLGLLLATAPVPARAQFRESQREYALKAVYLYNFCQFIEWPPAAFTARNAPLTIGVLGDDPFGGLLEETVQGEVLRGRPVRVERYQRAEEARNCQLLFITRSQADRTASIVAALRGRSIVIVGETAETLDLGGMIALIAEGNRVRLRINPAPLRLAGLSVSSKLMRAADIQR